ncbi:MAG: M6 family metalloprotease domain-containing protein [Salinivirgaceae bacterium]|nr:M6 family metalloprotease domain-containing protein [Salinivirgaceae bacterium]
MKVLLKYISVITLLLLWTTSKGAYLTNVPVTVTQPSGEVLHIYASGDEFYNWLHDADGYTIIQDPETGYYCYADLNKSEELYATKHLVGKASPKALKLASGISLSSAKKAAFRDEIISWTSISEIASTSLSRQKGETKMCNLVIYIRFKGEDEFPERQSDYELMFNGKNTGDISLYNYFKEVSYNNLYIESYFPQCNGNEIVSYQDDKRRGYYQPYNEENTDGYDINIDRNIRYKREYELLSKAIKYVDTIISDNINLDADNNSLVDNVCFIIRGEVDGWNNLLWPHKAWLPSINFEEEDITIKGKKIGTYNLHLENRLINSNSKDVGVLCHEMFHSLGAPDLYQYKDNKKDVEYGTPVGSWDLMGNNNTNPQHMGTYMKYKYGKWIDEIPEITESGTYTLNPIWSKTKNCYKLATNNPNEYFVLEYRKKRESGKFESQIPGSGLIVYRINEQYVGNRNGEGYGGQKDGVYVFRPGLSQSETGVFTNDGDVSNAYLPGNNNKHCFNGIDEDFYCFLSDGTRYNISINNISEPGETISFSIKFCDGVEYQTYTSSDRLPKNTNAVTITTSGNVVVKSTDNVTFDANKVTLNPGFKTQVGAKFKISNEGCCVKKD